MITFRRFRGRLGPFGQLGRLRSFGRLRPLSPFGQLRPLVRRRRCLWHGAVALLLAPVTVAPACPAPVASAAATSAASRQTLPDLPASAGVAAPRALPPAGAQYGQAHRAATALRSYAAGIQRRLAGYRRWGLEPLPPAPAPPELRPRPRAGGLPEVLRRVPTADRVIFLTVDDGAEQDPEFLRLVRDLRLPVSSFLTDHEVGADYGYFRQLQGLGNGVHNHTVAHPDLSRLPYPAQRREICDQRDNLDRALGRAPRLFRPPYGSFGQDTRWAARDCGYDQLVLWTVEAKPDRIDFRSTGRFQPGDIVLTHFNGPTRWDGTMVEMARRLLRRAAAEGFAVARLEDYLPPRGAGGARSAGTLVD